MRSRIVAIFLLLCLFAGPLPAKEPGVGPALYNVLSDDDEAAFGRAAAARLAREMPMLDDPVIDAYLGAVGGDLAKHSWRNNITYHFRVIDSPQINSFALPGGYIYVTRGLLDFLQSESELSGVLAHEISHIVAHHGSDELSRQLIAAKLATQGARLVGVSDDSALKMLNTVGGPVVAFVQHPLNQAQELEADRLGVYNMYRAGWDPHGYQRALERYRDSGNSGGLLSALLANHPPVLVRIEAVKLEIVDVGNTNNLLNDSIFFQAAKARMLLLPPPKGK
ncbi:MAG: M48 family metalloprotease [Acidobacteriota bacterium]|nr:M48 family metalloprotease [Acidobacteriota bacterium]